MLLNIMTKAKRLSCSLRQPSDTPDFASNQQRMSKSKRVDLAAIFEWRVFGFMVAIGISACSSVSIKSPLATVSPFKEEKEKNYELGHVRLAAVGDPIIKRKSYFVRTIVLRDRAEPDIDFSMTCDVPLNKLFEFHGIAGTDIPVEGSASIDGNTYEVIYLGRTVNSGPGLKLGMLVDEQSGMSVGTGVWRTGFGNWTTGGGASFTFSEPHPRFTFPIRTDVDKTKGFENIELIFTGIGAGKTVSFLYREFTPDDMARAAYFQNLSYDLSESNVIAFKTFR